jgi:hypothetical protein
VYKRTPEFNYTFILFYLIWVQVQYIKKNKRKIFSRKESIMSGKENIKRQFKSSQKFLKSTLMMPMSTTISELSRRNKRILTMLSTISIKPSNSIPKIPMPKSKLETSCSSPGIRIRPLKHTLKPLIYIHKIIKITMLEVASTLIWSNILKHKLILIKP